MKKIKFSVIVMILIAGTLIYCEKQNQKNQEEIAGQIPGMGNAEGELQVTQPFVLPEGISIEGNIKGVGDPPATAEGVSDMGKSRIKNGSYDILKLGSGGQWIVLDLIFANANPFNIEFIIPGGCVFECRTEGYQHGIALQDIPIEILAGKPFHLQL